MDFCTGTERFGFGIWNFSSSRRFSLKIAVFLFSFESFGEFGLPFWLEIFGIRCFSQVGMHFFADLFVAVVVGQFWNTSVVLAKI